jgi:hypothetical protein
MNTLRVPLSWIDTASAMVGNSLTAVAAFLVNVASGISDTIGMLGHGIQIAEATAIDAAESMLDRALATTKPALIAIAEWADSKIDPLIEVVGESIAEIAIFIFGLFGVETPSFDGFGCFGI